MRPAHASLLTLALAVWGPSTAVRAQHETAADIQDGGRVFQNTCANCHGPDGDAIAGIDLGRGQFRRTMTDEALVQIIRNGIPGTPMPASNFSEEQASHVVAYLRAEAASKRSTSSAGNAVRGHSLFDGKGTCATCHQVGGNGSRLGPDLTDIGQRRRAAELEQSLLEPDAEVLGNNRFYRAVLKDGTTVTGRLLNLDTFSVQLLDSREQLRSFMKSDLREHGFVEKSPMPSFKGTLNAQEVSDLVSYLVSLKGKTP